MFPARADLEEAKTAAEEIINHSKAREVRLFDDADASLEPGSGRFVAVFSEGGRSGR